MDLDDLRSRINNTKDYYYFIQNIDSFDKVVGYAEAYDKDIERFDNNRQIVLNSGMPETEKEKFNEQIKDEYEELQNKDKLLKMFNEAYNLFLSNYEKLLEIDVEHASNKAEAQENKKRLLDENMEILKLMPEPLKKELQAKAKELRNNKSEPVVTKAATEAVPDYDAEYNKIEYDFDNLLGGKIVEEIGLNDLEKYNNDYANLKGKLSELLERIEKSANKGLISDEVKKKLTNNCIELDKKIGKMMDEIIQAREVREALKEQINESIKIGLQNDVVLLLEMKQLQDEIKANAGLVDRRIIDEKLSRLSTKESQKKSNDSLIELFKSDLEIVEKGGKLEPRDPIKKIEVTPVSKAAPAVEAKPTVEAKPVAAKGPTVAAPKPENKPEKKTAPRKKGAMKVAKEEKSNTLTGLIKAGKLPRFLKEEDLIDICRAYNINIEDKNKTELTVEQIQLLEEDHEIQMAMLNQNIFDRNATKIAQYDQLMAKYKEILANINEKNFSADYRKKVEDLLAKCEEEKKKFVNQNEKIKLLTHDDLMKEFDGRAMDVNDKIRSQYQAMDDLKKEAAKKNSKFRQRRLEAKMSKLAKRIERLKGKRSHIASKQQQIVNDKANKYIDKVTSRLTKFYERQKGVELSVDRINEIGRRIDQNLAEIDTLGNEIKDEKNLFERIGMRIESGRLKRETGDLQNEMDWEDSHGRYL